MAETLCRHPWDRVKGVVATSGGWVTINRVEGVGALRPARGFPRGGWRSSIISRSTARRWTAGYGRRGNQ
ncbi:MAG: hypothetical protein R6U12_02435 [Thioalkalivibrio sp.]